MSPSPHHKTRSHAWPRPKIDARGVGRQLPSPVEKRLIAALNARREELGLTKSTAGKLAGVDPGDARRALNFGPVSARTIRLLCAYFNIHEYEELDAREKERALFIEISESCRRTAALVEELIEHINLTLRLTHNQQKRVM